jgi:hypothetical protein
MKYKLINTDSINYYGYYLLGSYLVDITSIQANPKKQKILTQIIDDFIEYLKKTETVLRDKIITEFEENIFYIKIDDTFILYIVQRSKRKIYIDIIILNKSKISDGKNMLDMLTQISDIFTSDDTFSDIRSLDNLYVPYYLKSKIYDTQIKNRYCSRFRSDRGIVIDIEKIKRLIKFNTIKKTGYIFIATTQKLLGNNIIYISDGINKHAEELLLDDNKHIDEPIIIINIRIKPKIIHDVYTEIYKIFDELSLELIPDNIETKVRDIITKHMPLIINNFKIKCGLPCQMCLDKIKSREITKIIYSIEKKSEEHTDFAEIDLTDINYTYKTIGSLMINDDFAYEKYN